jgi:hypothetical protein
VIRRPDRHESYDPYGDETVRPAVTDVSIIRMVSTWEDPG